GALAQVPDARGARLELALLVLGQRLVALPALLDALALGRSESLPARARAGQRGLRAPRGGGRAAGQRREAAEEDARVPHLSPRAGLPRCPSRSAAGRAAAASRAACRGRCGGGTPTAPA